MTITRAQYINNSSETHNQYYGQFVNEDVIKTVRFFIGSDKIKNSKDKHFSDIPLNEWDSLPGIIRRSTEQLRDEAGEGWSQSTLVCIAKAAARVIKNENN